ncbi:MAG: TonB-dependent receptor [Alistipes sp.]|nr:TonB-dependent receptor [Alistipes sp.]
MRKELYKKLGILTVLLCVPLAMLGQSITVTGTVIDGVMNTGFPGATVTVKGTAIGQVTDLDGRYSITVPSAESVLVFSFLGYADQEVIVGNRTVIDVTLQEDSETVDEVVIIAYGSQNKGLVTSAISSVGTKDLVKSPAASVTNMLAGAMPGVSSVQTTGQPGADSAQIYVRGSGSLESGLSSPLVLVDGVEREFSQIDPNEIESISVLKDASSTAVFGVRGANGVILVTTRRGSEGKPTINVSSTLGLQQPISLVEQVGSYEYAKFWNMRSMMDNDKGEKKGYFTREQMEAYRTGADPIMYPNVNWMKEVFRDVFIQSKNNINISGGSENVKYFVSMGYLYQNGIMKQMPNQGYDNNYRYNRYNYRANLDVKLTPTTKMKLGVGGYVGKTQSPNMHSSYAGGSDGWILVMLWSTPWAGPGFVNGVRTRIPNGSRVIPVDGVYRDGWFATASVGGYRQQYRTNLNLDLDITQDLKAITKGLTLSIKGAYDNVFVNTKNRTGGLRRDQFVYYKSYFDDAGVAFGGTDLLPETDPDFDKTHVYSAGEFKSDTPLNYAESQNRDQSWYLEARLNYERTFGDHRVSGLFLYNMSRDYYPGTYTYIPRGYIGYVLRATYSYRNKYMADINIGYNGSENFAPGAKTRYGLFPAVSAGWVISEEGFMQNQNVISYLKLRASFGRVGNDASGQRFMYANTVWSGSGSYSFGANTSAEVPGMAMGVESNPLVTWETSDKQNYGIDLKFLDNRLSITADYFREHRTGILSNANSYPNVTAISWPKMNIGIVNNHGYEISAAWNDKVNHDFNYYVNANVSFARNKIIYMDEVPNVEDYMNFTGGTTGRREMMNGYGMNGRIYKFVRLYQESDFIDDGNGNMVLDPKLPTPTLQNPRPGDAMYADLNGDGKVNADDRLATGYGFNPEYTFGLNAGFNWKGLSFSMQWVAATNVNRYVMESYRNPFTETNNRGLLSIHYENCWTYDNPSGTYPRPSSIGDYYKWNYDNSTLWLMDASYIRLKNVTIGYTFTDAALKKAGISSLGVTLSGYNLLTFSKLKFVDPESNPNNNGAYPLVRLYSLGVNINF